MDTACSPNDAQRHYASDSWRKYLMARRGTLQTPGEQAFDVALRLTGLWAIFGAFVLLPLVSSVLGYFLTMPMAAAFKQPGPALALPSSPANGAMVPWFVLATVALVGVWWWASLVIRRSRSATKRLEELHAMTPRQFEDWVGARFREQGYRVRLTPPTGDHGIDLIVYKPGERVVVQCKRYRDASVGEPMVRDLYGAMQHEGADRAYLITTGRFTPAAVAWANGKPMELWDGRHIARVTAGTVQVADDSQQGLCPRCGSSLVQRRNRRTGDEFLGCSRYPNCRYTQPVVAAT